MGQYPVYLPQTALTSDIFAVINTTQNGWDIAAVMFIGGGARNPTDDEGERIFTLARAFIGAPH